MTDFLSYLFVIALLYLCECFHRVGPAAHVFAGAALRRPNHYPGNGTWGWIFANPLRPLDPLFPIEPAGAPHFDRPRFDARLAEYEPHARRLRQLTILLAVHLLAIWPASIAAFGFTIALVIALFGAYALGIRAGFVFRNAHRQLYKDDPSERLSGTLKFMLYPFTLFRPTDALTANLLAGFHPALGVVRFLPKPARREPLLDLLRRAANQPYLSALTKLAEPEGVTRAAATAPPKRQSKDIAAWCPICQAQFTRADGECESCAVPLARYGKEK